MQALFALQPDRDLLGRLDLLLEDGLGLTTETSLLSVVSAPWAKSEAFPGLYWVTVCSRWILQFRQYVFFFLGKNTVKATRVSLDCMEPKSAATAPMNAPQGGKGHIPWLLRPCVDRASSQWRR